MGLIFPVDSQKITSNFGARNTGIPGATTYHEGVDIGVVSGTPVKAANSGVVVASGFNDTSGNYVKIQGADGITTFYGHLSQRNVKKGETVSAGDIIALSGNTGISSGAHLHFGVYQNGRALDPMTLTYDSVTVEPMSAEAVEPMSAGAVEPIRAGAAVNVTAIIIVAVAILLIFTFFR